MLPQVYDNTGSTLQRGRRRVCCAFSIALCSALQPAAAEVAGDVSLGLGYRDAELDWNIAGGLDGTGPNVLSELRWYDVRVPEVSAAAELRVDKALVLRGRASYGEIADGRNQDSDYDGDNRTSEFSRSISRTGGEIAEATLGVGYQFWWYDTTAGRYARIVPQFGYAWRGQYLDITDGRQVIGGSGPIDGLNSSYDAEWQGPWLGLALDMDVSDSTRMILEMQYHHADYRAEANWNLRTEWAHPVSFLHETRATGVVATLAVTHALTRRWTLDARIESQRFKGEAGLDTVYTIADDGSIEPMLTRLNAVHWRSVAANLGVTFRF